MARERSGLQICERRIPQGLGTSILLFLTLRGFLGDAPKRFPSSNAREHSLGRPAGSKISICQFPVLVGIRPVQVYMPRPGP